MKLLLHSGWGKFNEKTKTVSIYKYTTTSLEKIYRLLRGPLLRRGDKTVHVFNAQNVLMSAFLVRLVLCSSIILINVCHIKTCNKARKGVIIDHDLLVIMPLLKFI